MYLWGWVQGRFASGSASGWLLGSSREWSNDIFAGTLPQSISTHIYLAPVKGFHFFFFGTCRIAAFLFVSRPCNCIMWRSTVLPFIWPQTSTIQFQSPDSDDIMREGGNIPVHFLLSMQNCMCLHHVLTYLFLSWTIQVLFPFLFLSAPFSLVFMPWNDDIFRSSLCTPPLDNSSRATLDLRKENRNRGERWPLTTVHSFNNI